MEEGESCIKSIRNCAARNIGKIVVKRIMEDLLANNYRDVLDVLEINIDFSNFQNYYGLYIAPKENGGAFIGGVMPVGLAFREDFNEVIRGSLAHELAHAALKHHKISEDNLSSILYCIGRDKKLDESLRYLPVSVKKEALKKIGDACFARIEHSTDEEVIRRGLGLELYMGRVFCEDFRRQNDGSVQPEYYTSLEIAELVKRTL